jgi:hypothetical protein
MGFFGGIKNALLGSPSEPASFLNPELDYANALAARESYQFGQQARQFQGGQLAKTNELLGQYGDLGQSGNLANAEIEQRRRALGVGQQSQARQINQSVARRGLGGSASGLFAEANANRANDLALQNLEGSRGLLENQYTNQILQRRGALLGQANSLIAGAQQPTIQYVRPGTQGKQGLLGLIGAGAGAAFGGGVGAGIGQQLGNAGMQAFQDSPNQQGAVTPPGQNIPNFSYQSQYFGNFH